MPRTVLITGSSSGFGKAAADHFAVRGWNVAATMRRPDRALFGDDERILVTRLDVQDRVSIDMAIEASIARFGQIDAVVNNAGYGLMTVFEGASRTAIQEQFDVNLFGVMDVTRALLPHFRANGAGVIINISSGTGIFGAPGASVYSASKFALEGFSEALSYELASLGIIVKLVEPGGAPGTGFLQRAAVAGADYDAPAAYLPFVDAIGRVYAGMGESADRDALDKVVGAIFEAATDGTRRLRYQPTADIRAIVDARRSSGEAQYEALVRSIFMPIQK